MRAALLSFALAGCTMNSAMDSLLPTVPASATQVVVVRPSAAGSIHALLAAYERSANGWKLALGPLPAVVGRTGVIAGAQKREGDGHTPAGIYPLQTAFGYAPTLATGLQYRQATADDYWVDESTSPHYNQWVTGRPAVSAEQMRRDDDQRLLHGRLATQHGFDLSELEGLYRAVSFLGLGLCLIGVGWLYQRFVVAEDQPPAATSGSPG